MSCGRIFASVGKNPSAFLQPVRSPNLRHRLLRPARLQRPCLPFTPRRTLIAPPQPNSGPLMSRRADRALPEIMPSYRIWIKTVPIFLAIVTVSALAIFNYQKSSSSVVAATLYALRTSDRGRKELGDEIYFRDMFPWIWGELNQLHGRVNIGFGVKGTQGSGYMKFRSERKGRMGKFETKEWSLETEDGRLIQLLEKDNSDPFQDTPIE